MPSIRLVLAYSTVIFFVIFFLLSGVKQQAKEVLLSMGSGKAVPDFSHYGETRTLSAEEFPIDDEKRRVILVGDIHGMYPQLQSLIHKLRYDPSKDVLISAGDIVAKGSLKGSLEVLSFMASNNITAVRGNHDEKVIEWRAWIEWIHTLPSGKRWLRNMYSRFLQSQSSLPDGEDMDVEAWVEQEKKKDRKRNSSNLKWWERIPEGWKIFEEHYMIAEQMSKEQYTYMVERPLTIHIPHAHAYVAHAGVLASNPKLKQYDHQQPLARIPPLPSALEYDAKLSKNGKARENVLRKLQEIAILNDVPQNRDPWVTLNIRGVKDKEVTRTKDGTPWSKLYNDDMSLCKGFDQSTHRAESRKRSLPCHPATVIYGHAASRGLDIKRWTVGLDSGCVYENRLTSLVLGGRNARRFMSSDEEDSDLEDDEDEDPEFGAYDKHGKLLRSTIRFGDTGRGKIVSVSCA